MDFLKATGLPCRIYGLRRDLTEDLVDGNLRYRPFSEATFIDDLRTCRAVIAGGGFTLMSESVYLHKPMLSVPLAGQFEQVLNALYLQKLGYGTYAPELTTGGAGRVPGAHPGLRARAGRLPAGREPAAARCAAHAARARPLLARHVGRGDAQLSVGGS